MPKFVPRQRKHKVLQRQVSAKKTSQNDVLDTNAVEIVPLPPNEKELQRRKLREELTASQPRVSGKKAKRLEKYIESKLRKEEGSSLLRKLSEAKIDTSFLKSSKLLGVSKESRRDELSRALNEYQNGVNIEDNERLLFVERDLKEDVSYESSDAENQPLKHHRAENLQDASSKHIEINGVGSGLKRSLSMDETGLPVLPKRKKQKKRDHRVRKISPDFESDSEWDGISPSPSWQEDEHQSMDEELSHRNKSQDEVSSSETSEIDGSNLSRSQSPIERSSSGFKAWAMERRNEALDFQPSRTIPTQQSDGSKRIEFAPRSPEHDPLPAELQPVEIDESHQEKFFLAVERPSSLQAERLNLPVVREEQRIMETISRNSVIIICGTTGSGKTTQVPQFLFEAGYGNASSQNPGMVGITQPRRVAAVSMAKRVSSELGIYSDSVSYQVRFQSSVNKKSALKYMTDGVLLREVGSDISLRKYSAIIIDEAHERSINTDILLGMMSRVVRLREDLSKEDPTIKPLKLIIMSASFRVSDFISNSRLFSSPRPVITTDGQQFPVTMHFSRKTEVDYLNEAYQKILRGHRKLPPGGMLVFLTGQQEIRLLEKRLHQTTTGSRNGSIIETPKVRFSGRDGPIEIDDIEVGLMDESDENRQDSEVSEESSDDEEFDLTKERDDGVNIVVQNQGNASNDMHILPLYSLLPIEEQLRIFDSPPDGQRLIVLATNVAETSLTIPNIRYVFDCGRVKERTYNQSTSVQSFDVGWISKASAMQRAGRAGRTAPGHCYRLYSSAVFERDFEEHTKPEILRMPIESIVLQLKSMSLNDVVNFPFPTPPERESLRRAENLLAYLSAISPAGEITDIGRNMAALPLSPRHSRIILLGNQFGCMPYVISLVAALSTSNIYLSEIELDISDTEVDEGAIFTNADRLAQEKRAATRTAFNKSQKQFAQLLDPRCDVLKLLSVLLTYSSATDKAEFCKTRFIRPKALHEAMLLRQQLIEILQSNEIFSHAYSSATTSQAQPTAVQVKALKQILASGYLDNIAIRADLAPLPPTTLRKAKRAIDVQYIPLFPSQADFASTADAVVRVHPSSVLAHISPEAMPQYVIYTHLQRSSNLHNTSATTSAHIRMHPLTPIAGTQIAALAHGTPLLTYGKPIKEMMTKVIDGDGGKEEKRECWVVPTLQGPPGSVGWPLPAKKVVQVKTRGLGWVTQK